MAGGRNLTDAYFLRSAEANFIDVELLLAGPVVAQLGAVFDRYWNGPDTIPNSHTPGVEATTAPDLSARRLPFEVRWSGLIRHRA